MEGLGSSLSLLFTLLLVTVEGGSQCKVYNYTQVNCRGFGFRALPSNTPLFATNLDLADNSIADLPQPGFSKLTKLVSLNLHANAIQTLEYNSLHGLEKLEKLDLSHNKISSMDPGAFLGLQDLEELDLESNHITVIPPKLFASLKTLKLLNLMGNQIVVTPSTFTGLISLQTLNLAMTWITTLPIDVFTDLTELKNLNLARNGFECFPNEALLPLINIEYISMQGNPISHRQCDTINLNPFRNLRRIDFSGCGISNSSIHNFELEKTSGLEIDLTLNFIGGVTPGAFTALRQASVIRLQHNYLTSNTLERSLPGLENSNVKVLWLNMQTVPMEFVTNTTLRGLRETQLEELNLSGNKLRTLNNGAFQWIPHLTILNISDNKLQHLHPELFHGLYNLKTLVLSKNRLGNFQDLFYELNNLKILDLSHNQIRSLQSPHFNALGHLEELDLSYNSFDFLVEGVFSELHSLKSLNLKGNELAFSLSSVFYSPFQNFDSLRSLHFSSDYYQLLHLDQIPLVEELYIDTNSGVYFSFNVLLNLNLTNLHTLNITGPCIVNLKSQKTIPIYPAMRVLALHDVSFYDEVNDRCTYSSLDFLRSFPNLEELYITGGKISLFEILPNKLPLLKTLDLSNNQITHIDEKQIRAMPNLQSLNLLNNPFDCSGCKMKSFTSWLTNDNVVDVKQPNLYVCASSASESGMLVSILDFGLECNSAFMISVPIVCGLLFLGICILITFHFRWRIKYFIFLVKLKCGHYKLLDNDEGQPLNTKYDAFVCFNEKDRPWVMEHLVQKLEKNDPPNFKLCLHDRDFTPGVDIFENILDSIENSHKTMLILSPNFAESEWCYFEMRMAQDRLFTRNRDVLVLVLLEEIPDRKMPRVLRTIFLTKNYIKWPHNEAGKRLFWEELKVAIRSDNRVNRMVIV